MKFFSTYGVEFSFLLSDVFYKGNCEADLLEIYALFLEDKLNSF